MRKVIRPLTFQVFNYLYRQNYRSKYAGEIGFRLSRSILRTNCFPRKPYSTISASVSSSQNRSKTLEDYSEEYPDPKSIFNRVINEAYCILQSPVVKPNISYQYVDIADPNDEKLWMVTIAMDWPQQFQVEGVGTKKAEAERLAYIDACRKFKLFQVLDDENMPVIHTYVLEFKGEILNNPKCDLLSIYDHVRSVYGNQIIQPSYITSEVEAATGKEKVWRCCLILPRPIYQSFEAFSCRLNSAEKLASAMALHWMYENGHITENKKPILYTKEEKRKMIQYQNLPCSVNLPADLQLKMITLLDDYDKLKGDDKNFFAKFSEMKNSSVVNLEELEDTEEMAKKMQHRMESLRVQDVFTEQPYRELSEDINEEISTQLFERQYSLHDGRGKKIMRKCELLRNARLTLPIYHHRNEIMKLIEENQVVVICGETGCGKTTQVPQYILEDFIYTMQGSKCNIVVTQPRRISAISIAEYVASERGEKVGSSVGYQIRLKKRLPKGNGSILFCTTGILLRKLTMNNELKGVSHVIIDEVHERSIQIDILLMMMRHVLRMNKQIKLILMSASINTSLFSAYFDNCPVFHIKGKLYPVKQYFLDDIPAGITGFNKSRAFQFDSQLIANVLRYVDKTGPRGAILCFLPGWYEINSVYENLINNIADKERYMIYLLHSRLPQEQQAKIFSNPPENVRKIILSTNIAETSITIDDVTCVVDSGFHKETSFDAVKATSSIGVQLITKANILQRRGRAGRVQPGVCYHLIPREVFSKLDEYPVPEIIRTPLEKVVLDCKVHWPEVKAEEFLSCLLEPPDKLSVQQGVEELKMLGILDSEENLTQLGETVKTFATHPRLSKALVFAAFLRCLDPVLTVSALLTHSRDIFIDSLERKNGIKKIKSIHDNARLSDHLALCDIFYSWNNLRNGRDRDAYASENNLDASSLVFVKGLKGLFVENMKEACVIPRDSSLDYYNSNSGEIQYILAALTTAFYPNVIKLTQGLIEGGRLEKDAVVYRTLRNQKAFVQKESVLAQEESLRSPWLIYFSGIESEARKMLLIPNLTCVPGMHFLIFAGLEVSLKLEKNVMGDEATLTIDDNPKLSFSCSAGEAKLLLAWRKMMEEFSGLFLPLPVYGFGIESSKVNHFFNSDVIPVLKELLSVTQVPFTPDTTYKVIDGKLERFSPDEFVK